MLLSKASYLIKDWSFLKSQLWKFPFLASLMLSVVADSSKLLHHYYIAFFVELFVSIL